MYVNNVGSVEQYLQDRERADNPRRGDELGKDQFLQLLITQLRHQDPINPVEDKEFIAQLASFSSLEQMANLNKNMTEMMYTQQKLASLGQATQMIGHEVELITDEGENVFGRVTGVQFKNGWPHLLVDGKLYGFEDVIGIKEVSEDV